MPTVPLHVVASCTHRVKVKAGWKKIIHGQWTEWALDPLNIISLALWLLLVVHPGCFVQRTMRLLFYRGKQNKTRRNNLWLVFLLLLNHIPKKHWGPLWVTWPAKSQRSLMQLTLLQDGHLDHMVHFRPLTSLTPRILDCNQNTRLNIIVWLGDSATYVFASVHKRLVEIRTKHGKIISS